jgi:uncharacterized membrane protein YdbT with pleckstrin-like domain
MDKDLRQKKREAHLDVMVRPSPFFLFLNLLIVHLITALFIVMVLFVPNFFLRNIDMAQVELVYNYKIGIMLILLLIGEIASVVVLANWVSEFYIIKNDTLTYRRGIFIKSKRVLMVRQIVEVFLYQSMLGKLFNYGTIKIISPQAVEGELIKKVENPNKYFKVLRELVLKQDPDRVPQALYPQKTGLLKAEARRVRT